MTDRTRSILEKMVLAMLLPILLASMAYGGALQRLAAKEDIDKHALDIQDVRQSLQLTIVRDSAWQASQYVLIKRILCKVDPKDQLCH